MFNFSCGSCRGIIWVLFIYCLFIYLFIIYFFIFVNLLHLLISLHCWLYLLFLFLQQYAPLLKVFSTQPRSELIFLNKIQVSIDGYFFSCQFNWLLVCVCSRFCGVCWCMVISVICRNFAMTKWTSWNCSIKWCSFFTKVCRVSSVVCLSQ